ncbi:M23 family metallopeptidase [Microbacterium sp. NM3R9]|uniref:murein hydrolase activator EnvC family protein n=1 Tax=Microbacterium thalli TaxID=3027921 RepID=UPI00236631D8|nr:M23 family metallopeptidase [Microbacterium thalli]MDN8547626.1 M23 family metallopeptidase [Microbacterium thalli]
MTSFRRRLVALGVLLLTLSAGPPAAEARDDAGDGVHTSARWEYPLAGAALIRGFEAPAHEYGPGHRGIDLRSSGDDLVIAPAAGTIAFAGPVAGRPVVTIDHGGGLVSSLEPVETTLTPGSAVAAGDPIGTLSPEGHAGPGTLHLGARLDGAYINPLLLLTEVPRPILLPCC